MDFEQPLTSLVWLTSGVSVLLTYVVSYDLIADLGDGTLWWKLSTIITCGTLAGAIIPELVKVFTSTRSGHVREVVTSARKAAPLSACCPALWPATTAPIGLASPSSYSWALRTSSAPLVWVL